MQRSLGEWLAHQEKLHPHTIDLSLDRLRRVLQRLDWRQPTVPVITVAGTNGKGSVTAYCRAILGAAGFRVGTFTSPHLREYRERLRVHDRLVSSNELIRAFERIEAARLGGGNDGIAGAVSLTFFEYNALAAFLIFEEAQLDAWILEVGMGGRLDAVNVVDPTVAVVTSIGLDHQEFLGATLEAIAREKAGIFRASRWAVLGSRDLPPVLIEAAHAVGAIPKQLGREYDYSQPGSGWHFRGSRWDLPDLPAPALVGDIQFANAAAALAALEELDARLPVSAAAVAQGLESARLSGRFEIIAAPRGKPVWILDVAHNVDAARVLKHNLLATPIDGRTLAVCGILADKDAPGIAAEVRECFSGWWLAGTDGARGCSAAALEQRVAGELAGPVVVAADVAGACAAAAAAAGAQDRIVVFGSFHTVGPALEWLESQGYTQAQ